MLLEPVSNKAITRAFLLVGTSLIFGMLAAASRFTILLMISTLLCIVCIFLIVAHRHSTGRKLRDLAHLEDNIILGLNLQGAGRLESAFHQFKISIDHPQAIPVLYNLARDFEIVKNWHKASEIYSLILTRKSDYRDIKFRLQKAAADRLVSPVHAAKNHSLQSEKSLFNHRYEIKKLLGASANSKVYLACDHSHQKKLVALKVMNLHPAGHNRRQHAELLSRFMKESSTAAKLHHSNIVQIFDASKLEHVAYMSMEYIPGVSLKLHSHKDRLLPISIVLRIIIQCARALSYAHRKGVIHRDVKPANIIYDTALDQAKLTDFGIARVSNSTATLAGSFLGTPSYMSPEQIGGYQLDERSDIYSLGATLFRLLTGSTPFEAHTMGELMQAIASHPHQDILQLNPVLDPAIKRITDKALAKDPAQRYAHIDDMADELQLCLNTLERRTESAS